MAKLKLRGRELKKVGYPPGEIRGLAMQIMHQHFKHHSKEEALEVLESVLDNPDEFIEDEFLSPIAELLVEEPESIPLKEIKLKAVPTAFKIFGAQHIAENAITQMEQAMSLPVSKAGALMPDAHHGYGLPIGGVLATNNSIIPYGVGMDIGCRMCLSVYPIESNILRKGHSFLKTILKDNTRFGPKQVFDDPDDDHEILERKEFQEIPFLRNMKSKALYQLGSSGGGNHFVEYGEMELLKDNEFELPAGKYLSLLSHSGSRGMGAMIAQHFTQIAMEVCLLPKSLKNLAWLDLDSEAGMEYWLAMNLAGDYASACHHDIHKRLDKALGEKSAFMVENHHNFAWKETLPDGTEGIVHRKGSTPAGKGVLGIIPGSMTAPGFLVKGKGEASSLNSASHGAGRQMSRTKAKNSLTKSYVQKFLKEKGVSLLGGGLDEAPMAYKDIEKVMECQKALVEVLGIFRPKIVRMANP